MQIEPERCPEFLEKFQKATVLRGEKWEAAMKKRLIASLLLLVAALWLIPAASADRWKKERREVRQEMREGIREIERERREARREVMREMRDRW
jgi:hypothetical protein